MHCVFSTWLAVLALATSIGGTLTQGSKDKAGIAGEMPKGEPLLDKVLNNEPTLTILQRISELLTALQALDEQQLRRLEVLEYKLIRLEVQAEERAERMRTELKEASRRIQQVDWSVNKMDASLETIKVEAAGLRQGQDSLRSLQQSTLEPSGQLDNDGKLRMIASSLTGLRGSLGSLSKSFGAITANLSEVANTTRSLSSTQRHLVTKQHLTATLLELRPFSHAGLPICRVENGHSPKDATPPDCWAMQRGGASRSGVYRIRPPRSGRPFYAPCHQDGPHGVGWTVIQHRFEGSVDFFRGWQDYKHGFGNLAGEFWLGLEKIHLLTDSKVQELLIELQDFEENSAFAQYSSFAIGSEIEGYPITMLGTYKGTAGDSLSHHAGQRFSTRDLDVDQWEDGNCAETHGGAWWYVSCDNSNLNGRYFSGGQQPQDYDYQGIYWQDWHGSSYSLKSVRISVRPRQDDVGDNVGDNITVTADV